MPKLLLVEDDPETADSIRQWLKRDNHLVEIADNGNDALHLLNLSDYDLVILDWQLPKVSGIEVLKELRQRAGTTPVLMLTAREKIDCKEAAFGAGADDYLTKPFELRELSARIRALLRRPSILAKDVLTAGHVTLDPSSRTVTCNGTAVHLLPKEYALLEFLMRHPNQVFSSEALISRVWTSDSETSPDAVRKYVTRLRSKIDLAGHASLIETLHGIGYKLAIKDI